MFLNYFHKKENKNYFNFLIKYFILTLIFVISVLSFFPEFGKTVILKYEIEFSEIDLDSESDQLTESKNADFSIYNPHSYVVKKTLDKILYLKSKKFIILNPKTFQSQILFKSFLSTYLFTDLPRNISLG